MKSYVFGLRKLAKIARSLGKSDEAEAFEAEVAFLVGELKKQCLDAKTGLFVSGKKRQISCASQIWMVLAEVVVGKEAKLLLERMDRMDPIVRPVTPYLHHHLLEAYSVAGAEERMRAHLLRYWGAMVRKGMNVFPEVFVEDQEFLTPYGRDPRINSACHAWSCAPAYFLRRGR